MSQPSVPAFLERATGLCFVKFLLLCFQTTALCATRRRLDFLQPGSNPFVTAAFHTIRLSYRAPPDNASVEMDSVDEPTTPFGTFTAQTNKLSRVGNDAILSIAPLTSCSNTKRSSISRLPMLPIDGSAPVSPSSYSLCASSSLRAGTSVCLCPIREEERETNGCQSPMPSA